MFDKAQIIYNGNYLKEEQNSFFINNRAFLYGDSIFETMFVRKGKIHFFEDHLKRLIQGMKVLKYEIPDKFTFFKDKLEEEIIHLLFRNKIFNSARVRLTVFRKAGGLYTPAENNAEYVVSCTDSENENYILNREGLFTDIYPEIKKPKNIFSQFKTANSLVYSMAGIYAQKKHLDDCFISNENGKIIESISSNIFLVKDDILFTPPVSDGCINGIMRLQIIRFAKKYGLKLYEASLSSEDLLKADEIFLTNSIAGIRWVVAYKDKRYFKKVSNFLTNKLNEMFS